MKEFWEKLLQLLPLYAAEGGQYTEADLSDLTKALEDATNGECVKALLTLTQEVFRKARVLDPVRLKEGKWRFISYPARLFACSLLSLLAGESFFPEGFWAPDVNNSIVQQHNVLHAMEKLRAATSNAPIRRTFVAWGIIKRGKHFILKRRENPEGDPDNVLHGSYGFPGGRVNLKDFGPGEGGMTPEEKKEKLAFLYGLPQPLAPSEESAMKAALGRALTRELQEELELVYPKHYTFSRSSFQMPPETFLHGANAQHCVTECRITPHDIELTPEGDALLAARNKPGELFTLEEIISPDMGDRKVFLDPASSRLKEYLTTMPDSAEKLDIRRSELRSSDARSKKEDEAVSLILPLSVKEPLIVGDLEIPSPDEQGIELLLLLGLSERDDAKLTSGVVQRKSWGWLALNDALRGAAIKLNQEAKQICGAPILLMNGPLCRLRAGNGKVFFSPNMFRAELRDGGMVLIRRSLDREFFHLDAANFSLELSASNLEHLKNLKKAPAAVTYDNLRKLRDKSNQRVDDFVRQCGLFQLYEPIDGSVSKELQEFRFAVQVTG